MPRGIPLTLGSLLYSLPQKFRLSNASINILGNPLEIVDIGTEVNSWMDYNGVCYKSLGAKFYDMFSWVSSPRTAYLGSTKCNNNLNCTKWMIKPSAAISMYLTADGNVPKVLSIIDDSVGNTTYDFVTFTPVTSVDERLPSECFVEPKPCSGPGSVMPLDMVRLHGTQEYEVGDSNTADYVGDIFFTCIAILTGRNVTDGSSLLSLLNAEVYSQFGRYSFCNYYQCLGGSTTLVGRETTNALSGTGQCQYNATLGSWYSLPKAARCPEGKPLGESCAWRIKARVKTVTVQCLVDNGLKDTCIKDLRFPWPNSVALVQRVLTSDVCEDVPPESQE